MAGRRITAATVAFLALAFPAGCSSSAPGVEEASPEAKHPAVAGSAQEAVRQFYDSDTKHGTATFHSGDQPDETVEFWFAADGRYRLTWYYPEAESIEHYGPVRINMISPDGEAVYYDRPGERKVELAPVRAEKQQWTFNGPPDWEPGAGTEEDGQAVFTYTPEKLWDIEGADQQFYLYDLKVFAEGSRVVKVEMRTNSRKVPVEELVDSLFTFLEFELDAEMPEGTFDVPEYSD